jgi:hypothetical protein
MKSWCLDSAQSPEAISVVTTVAAGYVAAQLGVLLARR